MDLFTKSWDACLYKDDLLPAGDPGVPTLSCAWIVLQNVINSALVLSAVVAVFLIIYSGVQYITSGGDKEKVDGARKRLTYAIIGLVVIFLSFAVINFVSIFTGVGIDQLTNPPGTQPGFDPNPTSTDIP